MFLVFSFSQRGLGGGDQGSQGPFFFFFFFFFFVQLSPRLAFFYLHPVTEGVLTSQASM